MVIWDSPEVVNDWVGAHGGGRAWPGSFQALGYIDKTGKLVAGLVFYDCNARACSVNIAIAGGVFPIGLLKAGLFYVFSQLKLKRLTFIIAESNIRSQNLVRELGASPEATLREAGNDGNMVIFALFPANCKIWSRLNGQGCGVSPGST